WFGPRIVEPIGMHVAAKRYLCAAEPAYFRQLSSASKTDLVSQGGPLTPAEAAAFAAQPYAPLAIRLCRMDDRSAEIAAPRSLALFWDLAQDCRRESDAGSPQR
ncbi:MAG: phnH2, partial [Proteobacteria bacterium]|nr:phnH2 [Pseudomonadota bacterium]